MSEPLQPTKTPVEYIEDSDFKGATHAITGILDEQSEAYDVMLGALVRLFGSGVISKEKTLEMLTIIQGIYDRDKEDVSQLDADLDAFLAKFGKAEDMPLYEQELGDISALSDLQLSRLIDSFKQKQQDLMKDGKELDLDVGQKLNILIEEQNRRSGYKVKDVVEAADEPKAESKPEKLQAEEEAAWFVTPSDQELTDKGNIYVACGSPIISVLRSRYKVEYNLSKILDVGQSKAHALSGEEEYEIKRERIRQRDFVSNYLDPSLVLDQDICAYEMASEIMKDEYAKPACIVVNDNTFLYRFNTGYLKDVSDFKTGRHIFSEEDGNILGRVCICLNRKEKESGRPIDDAYDILELDNGAPVFYFYSSKGVSALSAKMVKDIALAVKRTTSDLSVPKPAEIGAPLSEEELAKFITSHKARAVAEDLVENTDTAAKAVEASDMNAPSKLDSNTSGNLNAPPTEVSAGPEALAQEPAKPSELNVIEAPADSSTSPSKIVASQAEDAVPSELENRKNSNINSDNQVSVSKEGRAQKPKGILKSEATKVTEVNKNPQPKAAVKPPKTAPSELAEAIKTTPNFESTIDHGSTDTGLVKLEKRVESLETIFMKTVEGMSDLSTRLSKLESQFTNKKDVPDIKDQKSIIKNLIQALQESTTENKDEKK
jgi:hypothetical protein